MEQRQDRGLRRSGQEVGQVLDLLDEGGENARLKNLRAAERYAYRAKKLIVEIIQPDGQKVRYSAASRNISSGGASLILGQFAYPGSTCTVHLVSVHNYWQKVVGKIVRCRYVPGSRNLHEVGIAFDRRIDVTMFHRAASSVRMLLVDDDPAGQKLIERLLKNLNVKITRSTDIPHLKKVAVNSVFDFGVIDLDVEGLDAFALLTELREGGFLRPVLATSASSDPQVRAKALEAGFGDFIPKPTDEATLTRTVESLLDEPLISTLVHDQNMSELIDAFVGTLHKTVAGLETAYASKNLPDLAKLARRLKGQAGSYGFEVITEAAGKLEHAVGANAQAQECRALLNQLIRWCLAARPVSCAEQGRPAPAVKPGPAPVEEEGGIG